MEFSDLDRLAAAIQKERQRRPIEVLAIEGHSTSGKSHLAAALGDRLGMAVVSTDRFLSPGCETCRYVECLDLARLKSAVLGMDAPCIIEGIAAAESLGLIERSADLTVYCKRITAAGLWADDLANYLVQGRPAPDLSMVDRWSVEYHLRRDPEKNSELVYRWVEE